MFSLSLMANSETDANSSIAANRILPAAAQGGANAYCFSPARLVVRKNQDATQPARSKPVIASKAYIENLIQTSYEDMSNSLTKKVIVANTFKDTCKSVSRYRMKTVSRPRAVKDALRERAYNQTAVLPGVARSTLPTSPRLPLQLQILTQTSTASNAATPYGTPHGSQLLTPIQGQAGPRARGYFDSRPRNQASNYQGLFTPVRHQGAITGGQGRRQVAILDSLDHKVNVIQTPFTTQ